LTNRGAARFSKRPAHTPRPSRPGSRRSSVERYRRRAVGQLRRPECLGGAIVVRVLPSRDVLDILLELRQRNRIDSLSAHRSFVERRQVIGDQLNRPAVRDEMMLVQIPDGPIAPEPQDRGIEETRAQIERTRGSRIEPLLQRAWVEPFDVDRRRHLRVHHAHACALLIDNRRPQRIRRIDDRLKRTGEEVWIQLCGHIDNRRRAEYARIRVQVVSQPDVELGGREWDTLHECRGVNGANVVPDAVHVSVVMLPLAAPTTLLGILDRGERIRARRFRSDAEGARYAWTHIVLRQLIARRLRVPPASVVFDRRAGGKPFVAGAHGVEFSVSRSGGLAVFAVSERPVGVDVERVVDGVWTPSFARTQFGDSLAGAPQRELFREWARREALAKYTGAGLTNEPPAPCPTPREIELRVPPGYVAMLAASTIGRSTHHPINPISETHLPAWLEACQGDCQIVKDQERGNRNSPQLVEPRMRRPPFPDT